MENATLSLIPFIRTYFNTIKKAIMRYAFTAGNLLK